MPPSLDLDLEKRTQDAILEAIRKGWVRSAHDVSDGGLVTALAECCVVGNEVIGVSARINSKLRSDLLLFSESQSRFIISVAPENLEKFESYLNMKHLPMQRLGKTGGPLLEISHLIKIPTHELIDLYYHTLSNIMES